MLSTFSLKENDTLLASVPARLDPRFVVAVSKATGEHALAGSGTLSLEEYKLFVVKQVPEGARVLAESKGTRVTLYLVSRPRNDETSLGSYEQPRGDGDDGELYGDKAPGSDERPRGGDDEPCGGDDEPRGGDDEPRGDDDEPRGGDDEPRGGDDEQSGDINPATQGLKIVPRVQSGQRLVRVIRSTLPRSAVVLTGSQPHGVDGPMSEEVELREHPEKGEQVFTWIEEPVSVPSYVVIYDTGSGTTGGAKATTGAAKTTTAMKHVELLRDEVSTGVPGNAGTAATVGSGGEKKRKPKSGGGTGASKKPKAHNGALVNLFVKGRGYVKATATKEFLLALIADLEMKDFFQYRKQNEGSRKFVYMYGTNQVHWYKQHDLVLIGPHSLQTIIGPEVMNIKEKLREDADGHFPLVCELKDEVFTAHAIVEKAPVEAEKEESEEGEEDDVYAM